MRRLLVVLGVLMAAPAHGAGGGRPGAAGAGRRGGDVAGGPRVRLRRRARRREHRRRRRCGGPPPRCSGRAAARALGHPRRDLRRRHDRAVGRRPHARARLAGRAQRGRSCWCSTRTRCACATGSRCAASRSSTRSRRRANWLYLIRYPRGRPQRSTKCARTISAGHRMPQADDRSARAGREDAGRPVLARDERRRPLGLHALRPARGRAVRARARHEPPAAAASTSRASRWRTSRGEADAARTARCAVGRVALVDTRTFAVQRAGARSSRPPRPRAPRRGGPTETDGGGFAVGVDRGRRARPRSLVAARAR